MIRACPGEVERPVWTVLRHTRVGLKVRDLSRITGAADKAVRQRLELWRTAGLLTTHGSYGKRYTMNEDYLLLPMPPKVDGSGQAVRRAATGRERMWRAIRALRRFSYCDLCFAAGVSRGAAVTYVTTLAAAGFVRVVPGGTRQHNSYWLVRRSGPAAPIIRQPRIDSHVVRQLYDPNDDTLYPPLAPRAREVNHVR